MGIIFSCIFGKPCVQQATNPCQNELCCPSDELGEKNNIYPFHSYIYCWLRPSAYRALLLLSVVQLAYAMLQFRFTIAKLNIAMMSFALAPFILSKEMKSDFLFYLGVVLYLAGFYCVVTIDVIPLKSNYMVVSYVFACWWLFILTKIIELDLLRMLEAWLAQFSSINLKEAKAKDVKLPAHTDEKSYAYGAWFYDNDLDKETDNIIFQQEGSMYLSLSGDKSLHLTLVVEGTRWSTPYPKDVLIASNVEARKWTHVMICFNDAKLEVFLNGKLKTSTSYKPRPPLTTSVAYGSGWATPVTYGSGWDCYVIGPKAFNDSNDINQALGDFEKGRGHLNEHYASSWQSKLYVLFMLSVLVITSYLSAPGFIGYIHINPSSITDDHITLFDDAIIMSSTESSDESASSPQQDQDIYFETESYIPVLMILCASLAWFLYLLLKRANAKTAILKQQDHCRIFITPPNYQTIAMTEAAAFNNNV